MICKNCGRDTPYVTNCFNCGQPLPDEKDLLIERLNKLLAQARERIASLECRLLVAKVSMYDNQGDYAYISEAGINERRVDLLVLMHTHPENYNLYVEVLHEIEHLVGVRTYGNASEREQAAKRLKELGVD